MEIISDRVDNAFSYNNSILFCLHSKLLPVVMYNIAVIVSHSLIMLSFPPCLLNHSSMAEGVPLQSAETGGFIYKC